ncbi:MAG: aminotransferase class I/II-fold pyridoxal phosphate-dependent enzyme [Anaerolineaceae bacterium]|jgi:LL-diaminopimelate aminotransferase|nr:aminotransferase class I/II-fold pyridoxal phosphate-dependent enzyme [Anaerolineaceae bacterium]
MMPFKPADRVSSLKPYFFATLSKKINQLLAANVDVIRIDIGSPDLPPAEFIIKTLCSETKRSDTHRYSPYGGTPAFRQAVALYYKNRFNVDLDPATEVVGLIGSKEGLFNLSQILLDPGDLVLVTNPGYPVYKASAAIAGAEVYMLPLLSENDFLPNLDAIPGEVAEKAKLMWLNYPNNPTGAVASLAFFEKAVDFARKHHILIAHDAPYVDICFDGYIAPSMLQVPGAKDVVLEFNSLSKAYNMAGWRLGMAVGNPQITQLLHTYKTQIDTSHFAPILSAGVAALTGDQTWLEERNRIYQQRRDIVVKTLKKLGFGLNTPPAAIYIWAHLPEQFPDDFAFCSALLDESGISITPGSVYGEYGSGYIRISLGTKTEKIEEAMQRLTQWFQQKGKSTP